MKKVSKNRNGFTLAEEVVTVMLVAILIATSSGILIHAMRFFCQNILTLTAQQKGIAVMDQLTEHLTYATEISTTGTFGTNPYQVQLTMTEDDGKHCLTADVCVKYASDGGTVNTTNQICSLGGYDAQYTVTGNAGESQVTIDLSITKSETTYYSDRRTIAIQNLSNAAAFSYSSTAGSLYIESLE